MNKKTGRFRYSLAGTLPAYHMQESDQIQVAGHCILINEMEYG